MLLKLFGAILVIAGCGGFGILIAVTHKKEVNALDALLQTLDFLMNELRYRLSPLPELCSMAANITNGTLHEFFLRLEKEMNKHISHNASACVTAVLDKMDCIPSTAKDLLQRMGDSLGQFDVEGQLNALEALRLQAAEIKENQSKNLNERLRSYQTLGLCAGAALAILLV